MKRFCFLWMAIVLTTACQVVGPSTMDTQRNADLSTDTRSSEFATDAEKVGFLAQYLKLFSEVEAAEFHIVYYDNSGSRVPGPSEWEMRAAMNVAPEDVALWTKGMQPIDAGTIDLSWALELLPDEPRWALETEPTVYQRGAGTTVAIFAKEGIVFKRVTTNP